MTTWSPDTCKCVFDVADWDDHSKNVVVSACEHHAHLSGSPHFTTVYHGENRAKNFAVRDLLASHPSLTVPHPENAQARVARPGLAVEFRFDASRQLELIVDGATPAEQAGIATAFGTSHPNVTVTHR